NNEFWREIRFLGVYNNQVSYDEGEVVQTADGLLWTSVIDNNTGNNPATDNGSNWIPAVSGGSSSTSTSAFAAFENVRTRNNAGMGFAEWGLSNGDNELVNEGIYCDPTVSNGGLYIGYDNSAGEVGSSRTKYPIVNVAGIEINLKSVATAATNNINKISLPPSPNGLKAYDSDTGVVTEYATITEAFAAETATNKVITSRKDSVFIEIWIENINDLGVVYVGGNVQNGEVEYEGVTLDKNSIDQSYSAFGEWDSVTHGNNAVWSSLTENEKDLFRNDPQNNIVGDTQARFRVRVIEGLSNTPKMDVVPDGPNGLNPASTWTYGVSFIRPRGKINTSFSDCGPVGTLGLIACIGNGVKTFLPIGGSNPGEGYCSKSIISEPWAGSDEYGVNGVCVCIPIGFVQRRNSGAHEPTFNPNGCAKFSGDLFWYEAAQVNRESAKKCFVNAQTDGDIASGVSGRPNGKYYDAVYASDIKDLRMSTKRLPHKEMFEKAKKMAHN
ncbi:MAG: hypothetical protein GY928_38515, partial [Colwellia sp.]|nr:hypothetical protein [Colwellia sp.]